jgi:hypothetical protein
MALMAGYACEPAMKAARPPHAGLHRAPITFFSRGIHSSTFGRSAINRFAETGNGVGSVSNGNGK